MSKAELDRLREACIEDIGETLRRSRHGEALRATEASNLPDVTEENPAPYADRDVCLLALIQRHEKSGPSHYRLKEKAPGLAKCVLKSEAKGFDLASYIYPTARTLVPFVLLLAMDTAFNPETILNINLRDIEKEHALWGSERWLLGGEKRRAGRRQYRSFPARATGADTPVQILTFLERFGTTARSALPNRYQDRVFAFWQLRGEPFASFSGRTGERTFIRALAEFRRDHAHRALPHFSLVTIRATMAEGIDRVTKDPKAKQLLLNHRRLSTTMMSYDGEAAKRRRREDLAVAIDCRERYAFTNGAADLRGRAKRAEDPSGVTPGFGCTMPRFSPVPGQKQGEFCNAYGACPTCELAFVDLNDRLALRRLLQLRDRIVEAEKHVHAARWVQVWLPRLTALEDRWLPRFDAVSFPEAMALDVRPIPRVE